MLLLSTTEGHVSRDQPCLIPASQPQRPWSFWDPIPIPIGRTLSIQILRDDQTRWEENFYRIDHVPSPGQKYFVTSMLMCDLFTVANLVLILRLMVSSSRLKTNNPDVHYCFVVVSWDLPRWLRWLRHSAYWTGWSIGGAGVQFPGRPVDFVFGSLCFVFALLWD